MTSEREDDNKKEEKQTKELLISGIPTELKSRFKILCYQNDISMSEVIVGMIAAYVDRLIDVRPVEDDSR